MANAPFDTHPIWFWQVQDYYKRGWAISREMPSFRGNPMWVWPLCLAVALPSLVMPMAVPVRDGRQLTCR